MRQIKEEAHLAFQRISKTLREAGADFRTVIEMTTYHVGISDSIYSFIKVKAQYFMGPYTEAEKFRHILNPELRSLKHISTVTCVTPLKRARTP